MEHVIEEVVVSVNDKRSEAPSVNMDKVMGSLLEYSVSLKHIYFIYFL